MGVEGAEAGVWKCKMEDNMRQKNLNLPVAAAFVVARLLGLPPPTPLFAFVPPFVFEEAGTGFSGDRPPPKLDSEGNGSSAEAELVWVWEEG